MDLSSDLRLRTTVLLLILSTAIYTKGLSHSLYCVNDYVSTMSCTLQGDLPTDLHMWLKLEEEGDEWEEFARCPLSWDNDRFFCSFEYDGFVDTDVYRISLCSEGRSCDTLDEEYRPVKNIKPKPPCCLTLTQNSSHFTWKSTYEKYDDTALPQNLQYQLQFHQVNGTPYDVITEQTTYTLQEKILHPDSECEAKVRSSPNQVHYAGQWSDWSPPVHWRTPPSPDPDEPRVFDLKKILLPVCVSLPVFLSLLFASVKKWRKKVFIPTPEPYFHSLYTDCHGDFKSWVIMEKTEDRPQTEKTSRIEKIFECEDVLEQTPSSPVGGEYLNVSGPQGVCPEPGLPYLVSSSGLNSAASSCTSACLSPASTSPTEGDSGCWLSSSRSLEPGHLWYCNDYCTLSAFQQSALGTAGGSLKCGTCSIMRHDGLDDRRSLCG